MFLIVRYHPDGKVEETEDLAALHPWLAGAESRLWVDLHNPSMEELEEVARCFSFHPLTIEDCVQGAQRPKLEEYDGYFFLVLHTLPPGREFSNVVEELDEIYVYETPQALVTVHQRDSEAVTSLRERLRKEPVHLTHPPGFLLHLLAHNAVDQFFPYLDRLDDEIDDVEDRVLTSPTPALLRRLFAVKRTLIHLRRSISPLREVFNGLSRHDYAFLDPKSRLYFREIYDHLIRASEIIETCRELVATTVEAYLSASSIRMNEIMKQLTLIATIFLPLTVITGFFGMNFDQIPFSDSVLFLLTVAAILAVPIVMLTWFARRGWLQRQAPRLDRARERQRNKRNSA
ncbi:MAG: magnesium/cobalt transporter CorA [candidate division NC10 bacterium]|nr:magnesium/cobalt transporter CorA [candidate division NC10 bacterium]